MEQFITGLLPTRFLKYAFLFVLVSGILLVALPQAWFPSFVPAHISGIGDLSFVVFFIIVFSFFRKSHPKYSKEVAAEKKRGLTRFKTSVAVAMLVALPGDVLYQLNIYYDKVVHFMSPFIVIPALSFFIETWFGTGKKKAASWAVIVFLVVGVFAWEGFEIIGDNNFYTDLRSDNVADARSDTLGDILFGFAGIGAGLLRMKISPATRANAEISRR